MMEVVSGSGKWKYCEVVVDVRWLVRAIHYNFAILPLPLPFIFHFDASSTSMYLPLPFIFHFDASSTSKFKGLLL